MVFNKKVGIFVSLTVGLVALGVAFESASAVITVQIGGATRLTSPSRSRYHCYWDCDLVGCQLTRDDDECAYDCEKICRPRYDYLGRSGAGESTVNEKSAGGQASSTTGGNEPETELKPKTGADDSVNPTLFENEINLGEFIVP